MTKVFRILYLGSIVTALAASGSMMVPQSFAQNTGRIAQFADAKQQLRFDDPSAAVSSVKSALVSDNLDTLAHVLGLNAEKIKTDEDAMKTYADMRQGASQQVILQDRGDRKVVAIGDKLWPLPFPLVQGADGKWFFDTQAGFREILNRRIGENELGAIDAMHAYVDAQQEYSSKDRDGDGVLEYAQRLISREGRKDGLYWPAAEGDDESPVGPYIQQAALSKAEKGDGYFGYRFRILTGQGNHVAGGSYDYIINGNMIAGYALIAWPVRYRETGVKTFMVNQAGLVYERDLGPKTDEIVRTIKRFDPDENWDIVPE